MQAGVVLLDKPPGISSFSAVGSVRRQLGMRRAGHAGTLDPFATGLLVVLVGGATRCARYFSALEKEYVATIRFGSRTDTDDRTGMVVEEAKPPSVDRVVEAAGQFCGTFSQLPPSYSAVHVEGRRAYQIARAGEQPRLTPRQVTVHEFDLTSVSSTSFTVRIRCSAGTYIRSIARDLGAAAGSAAHLEDLRRTAVGPFRIEQAVAADRIESGSVVPLERALGLLPGVRFIPVAGAAVDRIRHGGRFESTEADDAGEGVIVLLDAAGRPLATGEWDRGRFRYHVVLTGSSDA